ncbi:MAG: holo-ACP synthase [Chlamydiia bacterium]|nr:holo-ACP synthase [Chlamydiia bacterium]
MIKGLGNDILEIDRIRQTIEKHGAHFYKKFFNEKELEYCLAHKDPATFLAGRFAAKEAIAKAMGTGFGASISFLDIEILNDELGRPFVELSDSFNEIFNSPHIIITISHCQSYASAVALWLE